MYYTFSFPFLVPRPRQMIVDRNLSVMNIPKQLQHQEIPRMLILYDEKAPQPFNQSLLKVSKYYRTCWNFTQILYRLWNLLHNLIATLKAFVDKMFMFFSPFFWVESKTDDVCPPFTFYEKTTQEQRWRQWKLYVMLYICIFREIE